MDRCKELIARGYFRAEIPPVIVGSGLAEEYRRVLPFVRDMTNKKNGLPVTLPEYYSAAAYGLRRREMLIPNPANQLAVADVIANNWQDIQRHYNKSAISMSKHDISPPVTRNGPCYKPAVETTMGRETMKKARFLQIAGHSHILKADISQFFPSVYTHSIAWALMGQAEYKKVFNTTNSRVCWGDDLDVAIRNGNGGHTTGIPIGPATSHIISEIVMVAIDKIVQEKLKVPLKGYRYVDDYFLCFDSRQEAEVALAAIQRAAREYELAVNDRKTEILQSIEYTEEAWSRRLRAINSDRPIKKLPMDRRVIREWSPEERFKHRDDEEAWLVQFASEAFALAKKHPYESVMNYALKILRRVGITPGDEHNIDNLSLRPDNWDLYESILVRIMTAYPYTADRVADILCECGRSRQYSKLLNKERLSAAVSSLIKRHAPRDYHTETAWALWLAKVLKLKIADEAAQCLPQIKSGVCALLALDNIHSGLIKTKLNLSPWVAQIEEGPHKRHWLLAYEAPRRGWLGNTEKIDACPFFKEMHDRGITFYDEKNSSANLTVGELAHYDE